MDMNLMFVPKSHTENNVVGVSSDCETKYLSLFQPPFKISRSMVHSRHVPAWSFPQRPCLQTAPYQAQMRLPPHKLISPGRKGTVFGPCRGNDRPHCSSEERAHAGNGTHDGNVVKGDRRGLLGWALQRGAPSPYHLAPELTQVPHFWGRYRARGESQLQPQG